MQYPIAIEPGDTETAFGVVVPDLPGCFSAGDTIEEAITGAKDAVAVWIDATRASGGRVPVASSLDAIRADPAFFGWTIASIDFDVASPTPHRSPAGHGAGPM